MRLPPVSRTGLIRRLRELGWEGPYPGGRHEFMVKNDIQVPIPNPHGGKDIGVHLLAQILRETAVTRQEWLNQR